jgi:hypothetical protein
VRSLPGIRPVTAPLRTSWSRALIALWVGVFAVEAALARDGPAKPYPGVLVFGFFVLLGVGFVGLATARRRWALLASGGAALLAAGFAGLGPLLSGRSVDGWWVLEVSAVAVLLEAHVLAWRRA